MGQLIGRDAVFVEPAQLLPRLEDGGLMAQQGQAMGAGETRRPAADDSHAPARGGGTLEGLDAQFEEMIRGIALQRPDIDRLALAGHAHAGALAEDLGRADPGAGAAEDVLLEDGDRRPLHIAGGDLADESGNVDAGGTGLDAGGVVAEVAAARIHQRLGAAERRLDIAEIRVIFRRRQAPRRYVRRAILRVGGFEWLAHPLSLLKLRRFFAVPVAGA